MPTWMKIAPSSAATNASGVEVAGAERQRGADEHRRDRRRQRAHARRHHPDAHRAAERALTERSRPAWGSARSPACASPGRRRGPPAPPRCRRTAGSRRARAAGSPTSPSSAALKLAFSSRSANGDSASISRHHGDRLLLQALERHDRVDEPHLAAPPAASYWRHRNQISLRLLRARPGSPAGPRRSRRRRSPPSGPTWPKRALSAAIVRSQTRCSTCPPPIA